MDLKTPGVTGSSRPHGARRIRSPTARPRDRSAAERTINNQVALFHAEVREMLDEALDHELGIRVDDDAQPRLLAGQCRGASRFRGI